MKNETSPINVPEINDKIFLEKLISFFKAERKHELAAITIIIKIGISYLPSLVNP